MSRKWYVCLIPCSLALLAGAEQTWKDKQITQWTEDDARQVLTDSPWAKSAAPQFNRQSGGQRGSRGMGRGGGMGGGLGIPGIGGPRIGRGGTGYPGGGYPGGGYPGGGYPGGGYPGGGRRQDPDDTTAGSRGAAPRNLTVRWESALPVQQAELKLHDSVVPTIDADHYAVSVVGVPARIADRYQKPKAELKREGQKTIKSSEVKAIAGDSGTTYVFYFPKKKEITAADKQVSFETAIGPLQIKQPFDLAQMTYDGKPAL